MSTVSRMARQPWVPKKPSETCETWTHDRTVCGKPATRAYPAMGGGYMALCDDHAERHPYAISIDAARRGENPFSTPRSPQ